VPAAGSGEAGMNNWRDIIHKQIKPVNKSGEKQWTDNKTNPGYRVYFSMREPKYYNASLFGRQPEINAADCVESVTIISSRVLRE